MRSNPLSSALLLCVLAAAGAKADIIIGNLPASNDLGGTGFGNAEGAKAIGFNMSTDMFLTSARLRLFSSNVAHAPVVTLMSNAGNNNPGTVLATFQNPALGGGLQNYLFALQTPYELVSGTTYWLSVGSNANTFGMLWRANDPSLQPTGASATYFGARLVFGGAAITASIVNSFELIGNAPPATVPEPGAVITLSAALLGLGLCTRTRTRRRRGAIHS